jgi:hypothetical protein
MGVEVDEARAQIERLAASKTFETSEVHRRLLHYLAEKSLAGEGDRLKEYIVGLEAFGKPSTYDPKQDSIVRLQVSRLRQKLAVYYQNEANGDNVLISLPKGGFKLNFEPRAASPAEPAPADPQQRIRWLTLALAVAILWALATSILLVRVHRQNEPSAESWTPELESLWQPFLDSKRALVVCLGTPLFVRFPAFGFFRDPKANDWAEVEKSERIAVARKALGDRELLPSYNFTGAGEASAAFMLAKLLATRHRDLQVTRSNILSWQQVADENVIFIGPPKFNLQLQAAALTEDIVVEPSGIRNRKPRPGEPEFLEDRVQPGTMEGETHALITRSAGPSGVGELLVLAGNASADTLAAAEWLTQSWHARDLTDRLRARSGRIPHHFQVVLKVAFKQGIPVHSSYVFHHALGE